MVDVEHHIHELRRNSASLHENEESFLYYNLNLSLLYLLIDHPEQACESFDYVLQNLKKIKLISIQFGLTHVAIIAKIFSIKYGAYLKLTEQLDTILSSLLKNVSINTLNVDSLNGHFSVARYLLNSIEGEKESARFFQTYKRVFLEGDFSDFNKRDTALNEYEKAEFPMGYLDLGVPHGLAGTLFFLVDYFNSSNDEDAALAIRNVVSQLFEAHYDGEHSIIKGFLSNDENVAVQDITLKSEFFSWCYGTLGIVNALNYSRKFLSKQEEQKLNAILAYLKEKDIYFEIENNCFCHGYWGAVLIKKELGILNDQDVEKLEKMNSCIKLYDKIEMDSDLFSHIDGMVSEIVCQFMVDCSRKLSGDEKFLLKQLLLI
ncbi:lanthionine synthetase LanC family protein [Enterococcus larvae]|uniref:lanthionine synthetase LanC family protein n=1 Tax=Enterococcus larvae TaxID=2794352 RepID=UPI003F2E7931